MKKGIMDDLRLPTSAAAPKSSSSPKKEPNLTICINCGISYRKEAKNKLLPCAGCKSNYCDKCLAWNHERKRFLCVKCKRKLDENGKTTPPVKGRRQPFQSGNSPKRRQLLKALIKGPPVVGGGGSRQKSGAAAKLVEKNTQIREAIESTVEKVLRSPLDQTSTVPNLEHPKYVCLFAKHHAWISTSVEKMAESMQLSLLNSNEKFSSVSSNLEANVTQAVQNAFEEAMVLSNKQSQCSDDISRVFSEVCVEDFNSQNYEDILATAVLNKVIDLCDESHDPAATETNQEQAGTDTDSGLSGSIRGDNFKGVAQDVSRGQSEESLSPPCRSPKTLPAFIHSDNMRGESSHSSMCSSDVGVGLEGFTEAENWNYEEDADLQFKIEEHIEEITTHHLTDSTLEEESDANESDSSAEFNASACEELHANASCESCPTSLMSEDGAQSKKTIRKKRYQSRTAGSSEVLLPSLHLLPLSDPSSITSKIVPFPELGLDLIQVSAAIDLTASEENPTHLILENTDWEENWLFKRQSKRKGTSQQSDPVSMLIPYPNARIGPTIGDRDIDELSELSERNSTCSYEAWSGAESDEDLDATREEASKELSDLVGEITTEFGQKDQEYTEHLSIIDRLHLSQKYLDGSNENHFDVKSSTTTAITSRLNNVKINGIKDEPKIRKSLAQKSRKSIATAEVVLPPPPRDVPNRISSELSSSSTVWFETCLENENVPSGRALRLLCQVNARQTCGVSWYHKNKMLTENKTTFIWRRADQYHIDIFDMSEDKAGTYSVAAYTQKDCVWSACEVTYVENEKALRVPRVTMALSDLIVECGSDITLQCQVGGHPQPKVTFLHDGKPVVPSSHCYIENDQYGTWMLRFAEISESDEGQIKAVASNALGHAMTSCQIRVIPEGQIVNKLNNNNSYASATNCNVQGTKKILPADQKSVNTHVKNFNYLSNYCTTDLKPCAKAVKTKNTARDEEYDDHLQEDESKDLEKLFVNGALFQPPKPGTIAEREHRKWLEAKPLPNNPYSAEKLAHRLGKSHSIASRINTCGTYRDCTADESVDPSLRDGVPVLSDLSRYSRDYHVEMEKQKDSLLRQRSLSIEQKESSVQQAEKLNQVENSQINKGERSQSVGSISLVRIEPQSSAHWKEELKDIELNVGEKVADIQRTIDELQREWECRLSQKGWNRPTSPRTNPNHRNQRISSSCINLTCTAPNKKSLNPYHGNRNNRHLIYSSTEALNQGNKAKATSKCGNSIWRTGSVDTLNKNYRTTVYVSDNSRNHQPQLQQTSVENGLRQQCYARIVSGATSDSDDSFIMQRNMANTNNSRHHSEGEKYGQSGGYNRKMRPYYSENSAESVIEESDTESSVSAVELSNLPSVRELASKFDGPKKARNANHNYRKYHEKNLKSIDNKNIVILEQRNQNGSFPGFANTKYDRKFVNHEVSNHAGNRSLPFHTYIPPHFSRNHEKENRLRQSSRYISLSQSNLSSLNGAKTSMTLPLTSTFPYSSNLTKSMSIDGLDSASLIGTRPLGLSTSYSSLESDYSNFTSSVAQSPISPESNTTFGVQLRKTNYKHGKYASVTSYSDIYPISHQRTKSVPGFFHFDSDSDSVQSYDPSFSNSNFSSYKSQRPQILENETSKLRKSKGLMDLTDSGATLSALKNKNNVKMSRPTSRPTIKQRNSRNSLYEFLKLYENKKSINEVHKLPYQDNAFPTETVVSNMDQMKEPESESTYPTKEEGIKNSGTRSMQRFYKQYENITRLYENPGDNINNKSPEIVNDNETEVYDDVFVPYNEESKQDNQQLDTHPYSSKVQEIRYKENSIPTRTEIATTLQYINSKRASKKPTIMPKPKICVNQVSTITKDGNFISSINVITLKNTTTEHKHSEINYHESDHCDDQQNIINVNHLPLEQVSELSLPLKQEEHINYFYEGFSHSSKVDYDQILNQENLTYEENRVTNADDISYHGMEMQSEPPYFSTGFLELDNAMVAHGSLSLPSIKEEPAENEKHLNNPNIEHKIVVPKSTSMYRYVQRYANVNRFKNNLARNVREAKSKSESQTVPKSTNEHSEQLNNFSNELPQTPSTDILDNNDTNGEENTHNISGGQINENFTTDNNTLAEAKSLDVPIAFSHITHENVGNVRPGNLIDGQHHEIENNSNSINNLGNNVNTSSSFQNTKESCSNHIDGDFHELTDKSNEIKIESQIQFKTEEQNMNEINSDSIYSKYKFAKENLKKTKLIPKVKRDFGIADSVYSPNEDLNIDKNPYITDSKDSFTKINEYHQTEDHILNVQHSIPQEIISESYINLKTTSSSIQKNENVHNEIGYKPALDIMSSDINTYEQLLEHKMESTTTYYNGTDQNLINQDTKAIDDVTRTNDNTTDNTTASSENYLSGSIEQKNAHSLFKSKVKPNSLHLTDINKPSDCTPEIKNAKNSHTKNFKMKKKPVEINIDEATPEMLTMMIVKGSRFGKSGLISPTKTDITKASIPENSPFSVKTRKGKF